MFDLLEALWAAYAAGYRPEPDAPTSGPQFYTWRCRACDVVGRNERGAAVCWCCGGTNLTVHKYGIRDQTRSNTAWGEGEHVDRLIERS